MTLYSERNRVSRANLTTSPTSIETLLPYSAIPQDHHAAHYGVYDAAVRVIACSMNTEQSNIMQLGPRHHPHDVEQAR